MAPRLQLQSLLESIAGHVYFQPPTNIRLQYPCIIYEREGAQSAHANNEMYRFTQRYLVTVIDRDPDSTLPQQVAALPWCSYTRFFTADDLNHDVYQLFF